jgi:predicted alpha/beta-hydrolase family hydrolase
MPREPVEIPVDLDPPGPIRGWLDLPTQDSGRAVILLAHGAGVGMHSPFMAELAEGLCAAGFPVLRFHYAYAQRMLDEGRRRPPDRRPLLETVHRQAAATLRARFPGRRLLLAGKSMGGRMSSYLVAAGEPADGLVFFGYPLHPPKRPERLRSEHFGDLQVPALFLQGTRDALCDLDLLRNALTRYAGPAHLHVVEGADHGFAVLKRSGRTADEVRSELVAQFVSWEAQSFGART